MPKASQYAKSKFVKILFVGNSGAGKTGSLVSLLEAGYTLKIIDMDNGLDALIYHTAAKDSALLDKIEYVTFRDAMKMTAQGTIVKGAPKAYPALCAALEKWPEDNSDPAAWGTDTIFVLDSLTNTGRAAFQWARATNPTSKDPRQWYGVAQTLVEDLIANLTSDSFETNVIVISHIDLMETPQGLQKGFASSIGKALGPKLPRFFNTMVLSETSGAGKTVKRSIKTMPTAILDLKNPAPMKIDAEYPIDTGLAEIFKKLS